MALWKVVLQVRAERYEVVMQGGIKRIILAMKTHRREIAVQEAACTALRALSSGHDEQYKVQQDATSRALGEAGAIDCVTAGMKAHPNSLTLHENGLAFLANISYSCHENLVKIQDAGTVSNVVVSFRRYPSCSSVIESGCDLLWSLVHLDSSNRQTFMEAGGARLLINAMTKHMGSSTSQVHEVSTQALQLCCGSIDVDLCDTQLRSDVCQAAIRAMRGYANSAGMIDSPRTPQLLL